MGPTLIALLIAGATSLTWTIWKLWFHRNPRLDPRVYTVGVQGVGIGSWMLTLAWWYFSAPDLIPTALSLVAVWLWGGYFWGRIFLRLFPRRG